MSSVHPSAIGAGINPTCDDTHAETGIERRESAVSNQSTPQTAPGGEPYPEQKHAGAVGYGPAYRLGPTFGDKLQGVKEEIKGRVTGNHELYQHGKDMRTGELKKREHEEDLNSNNPFVKQEEEKASPDNTDIPNQSGHHVDRAAREQAGTVAPEGTDAAEKQRAGGAVDDVKHIG